MLNTAEVCDCTSTIINLPPQRYRIGGFQQKKRKLAFPGGNFSHFVPNGMPSTKMLQKWAWLCVCDNVFICVAEVLGQKSLHARVGSARRRWWTTQLNNTFCEFLSKWRIVTADEIASNNSFAARWEGRAGRFHVFSLFAGKESLEHPVDIDALLCNDVGISGKKCHGNLGSSWRNHWVSFEEIKAYDILRKNLITDWLFLL